MRRVKTASGAIAVQIVHKRGRRVVGIDHIGSAHDDDQLALLIQTATQRPHVDQHALELDVIAPRRRTPDRRSWKQPALILWDALCCIYDGLGFAATVFQDHVGLR